MIVGLLPLVVGMTHAVFQKSGFERNAFEVSEIVIFHTCPLLTFFYLYIAAHGSYNLQLN